MQPSRKKGIAKLGNGCNKDAAQEKPSWERVATKMLNSCDQVDRWEQPRCRTGMKSQVEEMECNQIAAQEQPIWEVAPTKMQNSCDQYFKGVQPRGRKIVTKMGKGFATKMQNRKSQVVKMGAAKLQKSCDQMVEQTSDNQVSEKVKDTVLCYHQNRCN